MADNKKIDGLTAATTAALSDLCVLLVSGLARKMTLTNLKTVLGVGLTPLDLLHVRDEKATTVAGGSSSAATWNQRDLNVAVTNTITGASLASDQITLPAGTYDIVAIAPSYRIDRNRLRLQNTTDASTELVGSCNYTAAATDHTIGVAHLSGRFVLSGVKVLQLQHYATSARATDGLGLSTNDGAVEVYADVQIRKVA